jgi:hypothetical protein
VAETADKFGLVAVGKMSHFGRFWTILGDFWVNFGRFWGNFGAIFG